MKVSFSLLLFLLALGAVDAIASGKLNWACQVPGFDIFSPRFSPAGDAITIARQRHIPDCGNAESLSEEQLSKIMAPIKKDKRNADPEVIITIDPEKLNTITVTKEKESGTVSPDGRLVAVKSDHGVDIRDLQTHRSVTTLKIKDEVREFSWGADSQRLAVVSANPDVLSVFTISR